MSTTKVKRTYGSRTPRPAFPPSSPPSALSSSPPRPALKRSLSDAFAAAGASPAKKQRSLALSTKPNKATRTSKSKAKAPAPKKSFTQLHFSLDTTVLVSCPLCDLSYTKGAPADESLHRSHCARVQRGMEWGREEEKERVKSGLEVVETGVKLADGKRGRIVSFRADAGGRLGTKLKTLLETINLSLSAPALTPAILQASKVYLFLLPHPSLGSAGREKIVGCVIAQRISTAMAIASPTTTPPEQPTTPLFSASSSLSLHPTPLPTPLGIPRLFTPTAHRRLGIAKHLLTAAARTAIHGCALDPTKGEVAFTQPTEGGRAVMESWGHGGVRVYEE
ncbi:hypothetical protein PLICRDRAFT_110705 [Plicaturopsis crispa FD-325 SS-3]|nr:hypothetical protein PLICRDRAFT_110705 [Plicaturopsis crispa FD-325 SS-3]